MKPSDMLNILYLIPLFIYSTYIGIKVSIYISIYYSWEGSNYLNFERETWSKSTSCSQWVHDDIVVIRTDVASINDYLSSMGRSEWLDGLNWLRNCSLVVVGWQTKLGHGRSEVVNAVNVFTNHVGWQKDSGQLVSNGLSFTKVVLTFFLKLLFVDALSQIIVIVSMFF
jgi:hypothetical protein